MLIAICDIIDGRTEPGPVKISEFEGSCVDDDRPGVARYELAEKENGLALVSNLG